MGENHLTHEDALIDLNSGRLCRDRILIQQTAYAILVIGLGSRAGRLQRYALNIGLGDSDPAFAKYQNRPEEPTDAGLTATRPWVSRAISELGKDIARRLAVAEALVKDGYDPNQPRVPAGSPDGGQWTTDGDNSDQAPAQLPPEDNSNQPLVHLPPGDRIDELGDLLEWVANARPEDEQAIRAEIKRVYYDAGDVQGGNALNRALSNIVYSSPERSDREAILQDYEMYTREDPAEVAQFGHDLVTGSLLFPLIPLAAAPVVEAQDVWRLGWAARGQQIETALGADLPQNFPVIDQFADGVATSIKSIDLNAATYQDAGRLSARLNRYVDQLADFDGANWAGKSISSSDIDSRVLNIAVPANGSTALQNAAIQAARLRAEALGVDLMITLF